MKQICKSCDRVLDETEFDMWLPAIRVRKETCKACERKEKTRWYLKELEEQEKVAKKKK